MPYDENGQMGIDLLDYNNRTDTRQHYDKHLIRNGKVIQAAEINEIQDTAHLRTKSIGDAIWKDGEVIAGMEMGIDPDTGRINCGGGTIYINGTVHAVEAEEFVIPSDQTVLVGVWLDETIVTEIQDGSLRDPAVGTPGYQQPGAARLKVTVAWGLESDDAEHKNGQFYALYTLSDNKIVSQPKNSSSQSDAYIDKAYDLVRRYDRESNGDYVVEGLEVRVTEPDELTDGKDKHVYYISAGKAHVQGYEVVQPFAVRLVADENPTSFEVEAETQEYTKAGGDSQTFYFQQFPVTKIKRVTVVKEVKETITHNTYSDSVDRFEHDSVTNIVKVEQGSTVYTAGTDFAMLGSGISWAPSGAEPSPGSTYQVTYRYKDNIDPHEYEATEDRITLSGLVQGTNVDFQYDYRLPRKDIICVDKDGNFSVVYGVSHKFSPVEPAVPTGMLKVATVDQDWAGLPVVHNDAIRVTTMEAQSNMQSQILDLYDLVAQERLKTDAISSAPTATLGVFVDPFLDDDMRDAGAETNDAAVVSGMLMLPLKAIVADAESGAQLALDYTSEIILQQTANTGSMKINPYQAATPLPATLSASPAVDRWEEVNTQWTSGTTQTIVNNISVAESIARGYAQNTSRYNYVTTGSRTTSEAVSSRTTAAAYMRVRQVSVTGSGFGPNENITSAVFAGRSVSLSPSKADANGRINSTFTVPSNVPCGTVELRLTGSGGSTGTATYSATHTVTTETRRTVTVVTQDRYDPLAQTFTLAETRYVTGVDLWFVKRGSSEVRVQIRDTLVGMPNRTVFAEGRIARGDIKTGQSNRIMFDRPVILNANVEYALIVLTDTSDHELAIAELGKWDNNGRGWLTSQPYEAGTLLSSSNASTWTPHQTMDLWFRLLGAKFTAPTMTVPLGKMSMTNITDVLPRVEVEYPDSDTEATLIIKDGDTEVTRIQAEQAISLSDVLDGDYDVFMEIKGNEKLSPVVYSGTQFVLGSQATEAQYISRAFSCGTGSKKIRITLNTYVPNGQQSDIKVFVQTGTNINDDSGWTEAKPASGVADVPIGGGWNTKTYEQPVTATNTNGQTRIKIKLKGTPKFRPLASELRAVVLNA